jgi:hypothetical protein
MFLGQISIVLLATVLHQIGAQTPEYDVLDYVDQLIGSSNGGQ